MRFTPKSEAELSLLLPDGIYDFEVVSAEDKISKAGNEMIAVTLAVFDSDGRKVTVFDYLLETVMYKVAHIASALGLKKEYERGEMVASDLEGRAAKVKISQQPEQNGYPAKNIVRDYLPATTRVAAPLAKPEPPPRRRVPAPVPQMADALADDEIPF